MSRDLLEILWLNAALVYCTYFFRAIMDEKEGFVTWRTDYFLSFFFCLIICFEKKKDIKMSKCTFQFLCNVLDCKRLFLKCHVSLFQIWTVFNCILLFHCFVLFFVFFYHFKSIFIVSMWKTADHHFPFMVIWIHCYVLFSLAPLNSLSSCHCGLF